MKSVRIRSLLDIHPDAVKQVCPAHTRAQRLHLFRCVVITRLPVAQDLDRAVFGFQIVRNDKFAEPDARTRHQLVGQFQRLVRP